MIRYGTFFYTRCGQFESNFLCAACDRHWEDHETYFDTEKSRKEKGLPHGKHSETKFKMLCGLFV